MAQSSSNLVTERHMWVQLKTQITPKDWNFKPVHVLTVPHQLQKAYLRNPNHKEWGFQTQIAFEPKLNFNKCNFFSDNDGWTYNHKKVTLDIFMKFSDISNHLDLRVCYIPKSTMRMRSSLRNAGGKSVASSPRIYRSYVWIFDICLIKMIFRDQNDPARIITKNFHVDSASGRCKSEDHEDPFQEEFAHFKKSDFIAKVDLESLIGHKLEFGETSFIPVDFELRVRLRLCPLSEDKEMMEPNDWCTLDSSETIQPIFSAKLALSSAFHSHFPKNVANKPTLLYMDFDVTFEINCESEVSTILHAHAWILGAQSPVFSKMLTTDMLEKKRGIIEIGDETTPESLALFLTCLYERMGLSYSENPENRDFKSLDEWTPEISFQTLQLAHKYQVAELADFCIESIISRPDEEFTTDLAVKLFKAGVLYESDDLRQRSVDWIKRQPREQVKVELNELLKEESHNVATQILLSLI